MKTFILLLALTLSLLAQVGTLKKVVDGDTVYFTHDKCRLLYIDTPESKRNSKAKRDTKTCKHLTLDTIVMMGKQATIHAKELLKVGKQYKYDVIGHDRYKRALCVVYTPKGTFNELMVKDGYAVAFDRYLHGSTKRKYDLLEREAKRANRGLWEYYNLDCMGNK